MKHVVQYPGPYGSLLNFYCEAESIEDAEQLAARWGIEGEGFEIIEEGEL